MESKHTKINPNEGKLEKLVWPNPKMLTFWVKYRPIADHF